MNPITMKIKSQINRHDFHVIILIWTLFIHTSQWYMKNIAKWKQVIIKIFLFIFCLSNLSNYRLSCVDIQCHWLAWIGQVCEVLMRKEWNFSECNLVPSRTFHSLSLPLIGQNEFVCIHKIVQVRDLNRFCILYSVSKNVFVLFRWPGPWWVVTHDKPS